MRPCLRLCMSHSLVMYNRNHTCLVSSLFSVLVERLVSVVVNCVVKDQHLKALDCNNPRNESTLLYTYRRFVV